MRLVWTVVGVLTNDYDFHLSQRSIRPCIDIFGCAWKSVIGGVLAKTSIREGYTLRDLELSSGPWTPSSHRNFFREIKYGFLISSLRSFNLEKIRS